MSQTPVYGRSGVVWVPWMLWKLCYTKSSHIFSLQYGTAGDFLGTGMLWKLCHTANICISSLQCESFCGPSGDQTERKNFQRQHKQTTSFDFLRTNRFLFSDVDQTMSLKAFTPSESMSRMRLYLFCGPKGQVTRDAGVSHLWRFCGYCLAGSKTLQSYHNQSTNC